MIIKLEGGPLDGEELDILNFWKTIRLPIAPDKLGFAVVPMDQTDKRIRVKVAEYSLNEHKRFTWTGYVRA